LAVVSSSSVALENSPLAANFDFQHSSRVHEIVPAVALVAV